MSAADGSRFRVRLHRKVHFFCTNLQFQSRNKSVCRGERRLSDRILFMCSSTGSSRQRAQSGGIRPLAQSLRVQRFGFDTDQRRIICDFRMVLNQRQNADVRVDPPWICKLLSVYLSGNWKQLEPRREYFQ